MTSQRARKHQLILGSGSPRRRELLGHTGIAFEVVAPEIDESVRKGESPVVYCRRMAREKAERIAATIKRRPQVAGAIIVTADTSVVLKREILGKPLHARDAERMLKKMQGQWHQVITAVCILQGQKLEEFHVSTRVKMAPMSAQVIKRYVATGEPLDKAGSYGAQAGGMCFVEKIVGSYSNVIGLPMVELLDCLHRKFRV